MIFLTAGESHGEALSVILSEYPAGVNIDIEFINRELFRRQLGYGRGSRMQIEADQVKILSGIKDNITTGAPIACLIYNNDFKNWVDKKQEPITNPRPGHADLSGLLKYHLSNIRDVIERSSARETAARVAAGAFAKLFLKNFDIFTFSFVEQIGNIKINQNSFKNIINKNFNHFKNKKDLEFINRIENSPIRCPDKDAESKIIDLINQVSQKGDTLGGAVKIFASGLPIGLGSYTQWDLRLDAIIAKSLISIPSVKAVLFGAGERSAELLGSEFHDEIFYERQKGFYRKTNNAGGIEGGMTNGELIEIKILVKPIPTTMKGLQTIDIKTKHKSKSFKERSDICAVPSIGVIAEAMLAIDLLNQMQKKFGMDNLEEITKNFNNYKKYINNI